MKYISLLFVAVCLSCAIAMGQEVVLLKGSSTEIPVPEGIRKLAVSNPSIIDVRPGGDGKSVVVSGLMIGSSDLTVERLQGLDLVTKFVVRSDLQETVAEIKELLADVVGLEIKVVGGKVVLRGNLVNTQHYNAVKEVEKAYSSVLLNLSTFDRGSIEGYVEQAIKKELEEAGITTVSTKVRGEKAMLEGVVYSETDMAKALEIVKLKMPSVINLIRVQELMIETDLLFVQVDKDDAREFGNNVLKSVEARGGGDFSGGGSGKPSLGYATSASAVAKINALVGAGRATVINRVHLSTKSGGEGLFRDGGETYFTVAGNVGGSLSKVEYGITMKVKPTMQGKDRVLNEVALEVSAPTSKSAGALSLSVFRSQNTVICKVGESVVLSGLIQTLVNHFNEKTPVLGDIPLLSLFFSQKSARQSKKELVALLIPRPVYPQPSSDAPYSDEGKTLAEKETAPKAKK